MQSLTVFLSALICSVFLTYVVRQSAHLLGFLDKPGAHKQHKNATPALGGIAILVSMVVTLYPLLQTHRMGTLLGASLLVGITGVLDDIYHVRATHKLAILGLASIMLCGKGWPIHLGMPFPLNLLASFLWVGFISSAYNGVDNADGAAGGLAAISALACALLAFMTGNQTVVIVCLALAGACMGFLVFNFPRPHASIFLGDSGSLLIGLVLACVTVEAAPLTPLGTVAVALTLMAVPVFDFLMILVVRGLKGEYRSWKEPITMCARDHTFHRLSAFGMSKRSAVLSMYAAAVAIDAVALAGFAWNGAAGTMMAFCGTLGLAAFAAVALYNAPLPSDVYAAHRSTR